MSGVRITNTTGTPHSWQILDSDGNSITKTVPICDITISARPDELVTAKAEIYVRSVEIRPGVMSYTMRLGDDFDLHIAEIRMKNGSVVKFNDDGTINLSKVSG